MIMDDGDMVQKNRVTVYFSGCENGLGMKICGATDENGNNKGIFVKELLNDSIVAKSGKVFVGDRILHCNGYSFDGIQQADAVSFLKLSAQTGAVLLVLDQTDEAHQTFTSLPERHKLEVLPEGSISAETAPNETSKKKAYQRRSSLSLSSSSNNSFELNCLLGTASPSTDSGFRGSSCFISPSCTSNIVFRQNQIRTVVLKHTTSIGITITGGTNRSDGPNIYISAVVPGGDVYEHGELSVGDMLISIDGESFVGSTYEQAKSSLSRLKLRKRLLNYTISYIPRSKLFTSPPLDQSHNGDVHSKKNQCKLNSLLKTPDNRSSTLHNGEAMALSHLRFETPRVHVDLNSIGCCSSKSVNDYNQILSPNISEDPMLKELLTLMDDIQDSEVESVLDSDSYIRGNHTESTSSIISPLIYSRRNIINTAGPPNTIAHYLNQDVGQRIKSREGIEGKESISESFSLAPSTCIKMEKLEMALNSLGFHPTLAERNKIRESLTVNSNGDVLYGDFVAVTKEVLRLAGLDDYSKSLRKESKFIAANKHRNLSILSRDMSVSHRDELTKLRRERDDALREVQYFRSSLHDKDQDCLTLQSQLEHLKQELINSKNEYNALQRQTRQETQRRSRSNQHDQLIAKLEQEVAILRAKQAPDKEEIEDMQKRLVLLGCQLRKSEVSKRTYEVGVDKLTRYVENLHVTIENELRKNEAKSENSKRHKKLQKLSNEARDIVKSIKMLLEEEPLPFGWEEVYSEDGGRYYMNHVTQTTSWIHPVSGVQHSKIKKEKT